MVFLQLFHNHPRFKFFVSPLRGSTESWGRCLLPFFHRDAVDFFLISTFLQLFANHPRFTFFVSPLRGCSDSFRETLVTIVSPLPYQEGKATRLNLFNKDIYTIVCQSSKIHIFCFTPTGFQLILWGRCLLPFFHRYAVDFILTGHFEF